MVASPRYRLPSILIFLSSVFYSATAVTDLPGQQRISAFAKEGMAGWEEKSFKGNTIYRVMMLNGEHTLQADSRSSASGMYKKVSIDLKKTPYLNWRWRIEKRIKPGDETTRAGDDYAARVYVVVDEGLLFWKSRALSYVWASQQDKGAIWNNAYAGKSVKMLALKSVTDSTAQWYTEKRNVYADLKKVFGNEITRIDVLALMTDTDDSESRALSYYADIYFSAD